MHKYIEGDLFGSNRKKPLFLVPNQPEPKTLILDLDNTLLKVDLLHEALVGFCKQNLLNIFKLGYWLIKGKVHFKNNLSAAFTPNLTNLPINQKVLSYAQAWKQSGKRVILASASPSIWVEKIAARIGIFDTVLATQHLNLTGIAKLHAIQKALEEETFDYAGDSTADIPIFNAAFNPIFVGVSQRTKSFVFNSEKALVLSERPSFFVRIKILTKAIRVHQWSKNLLLAIPLVASQKVGDLTAIVQIGIGFLAFSFMASAVYLINDIADIDADRDHPTKKNRPIAAGDLSIPMGIFLVPLLMSASFTVAVSLSWAFTAIVAGYFLTTTFYSFHLKNVPLVDAITLSTLFCLRVFAGSIAASIILSNWLIAFSSFLFFSLALLKRCLEIEKKLESKKTKEISISVRGYCGKDLDLLKMLGACSGYLSVVIFTIYIHSPEALKLYSNPQILWIACPFLFFWISRIWLLANRNEVNDDPVIFAMTDKTTYIVAACIAAVMVAAK